MSDDYTVVIERIPARPKGATGEPQFAMRAMISSGAGTAEELIEIPSTTLRMGFTYICSSAFRFLAENDRDHLRKTISFSWKQQHDQAAST